MTDLYKGINEFKKGYKPRSNRAKDEKGDKRVIKKIVIIAEAYPFC